MKTLFHITKLENLESILNQGLTVDPNRVCAGKINGSDYTPEGVYLTSDYQYLLEDECTNFGDSELVVLEVNVDGLQLHEDEAYDLGDIMAELGLSNPCYWTSDPIKPDRILKVIYV